MFRAQLGTLFFRRGECQVDDLGLHVLVKPAQSSILHEERTSGVCPIVTIERIVIVEIGVFAEKLTKRDLLVDCAAS